jgi:F-type H+-transporting ATPase subunit b
MEALGFNWKILLGQMVNFVILFYFLKRFAFKPFFETLRKRKEKIEGGLQKAQEAEKSLSGIRTLEESIKAAGEKNAKEVIKEAQANGERQRQDILTLAQEERQKIILAAKATAEREIEEKREAQKREALERSFILAEKILKEKFDEKKDKEFLEKINFN